MHALHHLATIAMLCRLRGIPIDTEVGMAPDTLAAKSAVDCEPIGSQQPK